MFLHLTKPSSGHKIRSSILYYVFATDRLTRSFICTLQIENEYGGYLEEYYGTAGKAYAMWAASMALAQNTGVPWIMCQQPDAPDPVVSFVIQCPTVVLTVKRELS